MSAVDEAQAIFEVVDRVIDCACKNRHCPHVAAIMGLCERARHAGYLTGLRAAHQAGTRAKVERLISVAERTEQYVREEAN